MLPFETTCVLWHPAHRDTAAGGTLRFDPSSGLSADLIGSLDPDEPIATLFEPPAAEELADLTESVLSGASGVEDRDPGPLVPVVFGVVQGHPITLLNVRRTEGGSSLPGHAHEQLAPDLLARGRHLPQGFDTRVRSLSVAFDVLDDWYDTMLLAKGTTPGRVEDDDDGVTVRWTVPGALEAHCGATHTVRLRGRAERHSGAREFRLALTPEYTVEYVEPVSLQEAIEAVTPLRWLTSLVTRKPARLVGLRSVEADDPRHDFDIVFHSTEPGGGHRRVHPYAMAVKLPDLDFALAVPRWMEMAERLRVPMALFFANWFSSGLYSENRVLNAAASAESLGNLLYPNDRTALSERPAAVKEFIGSFPKSEQSLLRSRLRHINDPSLRERLGRLAVDAGDAFRLVITDTDRWIELLIDTRNDIAHGNRLPGSGSMLRALSETTEHLIEIHLFMQLGMTSTQVEGALRETPRTRWVSDLASRYLRAEPDAQMP